MVGEDDPNFTGNSKLGYLTAPMPQNRFAKPTDESLWRFWNDKAREQAAKIATLQSQITAVTEERDRLNANADKFAETVCEGFCKESGFRGAFDDCLGCQLISTLTEPKP